MFCYCFLLYGGEFIPELPQPQHFNKKRLTTAENFLQPTMPRGNIDFYDRIRQTIGKEHSIANIQREDVPSYILGDDLAQTFVIKGLDMRARRIMNNIITELKTSMSIDNEFAHLLFKDTLEYTQTQNVHEYTHQPAKRSFFSLGKGGQ